jgi:hypothetical protein
MMVNYLDDFGGAETKEKGWKAYETLGESLMSCGSEESVDKAVTPTTKMTFLGVTNDTRSHTRQGGRNFAAGRILDKKEKNHL